MQVDKKIINMIGNVDQEERAALMSMLDISSREPTLKLCLAVFRDVYMFKQMSQALIIKYQSKIEELESRVTDLEAMKQ